MKIGKSGDGSGKKDSGANSNSITSGGNVRSANSNNRGSDLKAGGSDVKTASFLDKHSGGNGKDSDKGGDKKIASTSGSSKFKDSDSDNKSGLKSNKQASSSSLTSKDRKDQGGDSFLNKHGSNKSQDNKIADLSRDRNDGGARHSDWNHDDWHHGHHHGHNNHFALFIGFGSPFWGYGFYDPFWGGWGWGGWGWPGYYPYGGLAFGYHSRHFGFLYGTGWGYGYSWPYYDYDPCCVYSPGGATYIVESPTYAAAPRVAAPIATDGVASDATAIPSRTAPLGLDPTPVISAKPDPAAADSARDFSRDGELSFKKGDYKQAVREWRHALLEDPQNGTLIMMMAQAQFQTGDFNQSAGAVQAGMMMLPKDKWGIVVGNFKELYSDTQDYVDQVKVLEKAIKDDPKNPALRFLVGYHYMYLGYPAEALREFKVGDEHAKTDQALKELIKMAEELTTKKSGDPATPPPAEAPKKPDGK